MAEGTKIEWAHNTFNPWMGCTKVSPACANCYAERDMDHRYGKVQWGPDGTRKLTSDANWRKPLAWNRRAEKTGVRERVFCASLADVFEDWQGPMRDHHGATLYCGDEDNEMTMEDVRYRLFRLIDDTPHLDWLLLTKRPENIRDMWPGGHRSNVWLGASIENQKYADERVPFLAMMKWHGLVDTTFVSAEPVVGPIDIHNALKANAVDWVITGGESGPNARPADPAWFRGLQEQCVRYSVPFLFKQWGEFDERQVRVGKKSAGRLLDDLEWNQFPSVLKESV